MRRPQRAHPAATVDDFLTDVLTALWKAADWDPNFLDVLVITLQETPPTTNRKLHGGDSYAP